MADILTLPLGPCGLPVPFPALFRGPATHLPSAFIPSCQFVAVGLSLPAPPLSTMAHAPSPSAPVVIPDLFANLGVGFLGLIASSM